MHVAASLAAVVAASTTTVPPHTTSHATHDSLSSKGQIGHDGALAIPPVGGRQHPRHFKGLDVPELHILPARHTNDRDDSLNCITDVLRGSHLSPDKHGVQITVPESSQDYTQAFHSALTECFQIKKDPIFKAIIAKHNANEVSKISKIIEKSITEVLSASEHKNHHDHQKLANEIYHTVQKNLKEKVGDAINRYICPKVKQYREFFEKYSCLVGEDTVWEESEKLMNVTGEFRSSNNSGTPSEEEWYMIKIRNYCLCIALFLQAYNLDSMINDFLKLKMKKWFKKID